MEKRHLLKNPRTQINPLIRDRFMRKFRFLKRFSEKSAKKIAKALFSSSFSWKDHKKIDVLIEI
jgi:hypothetical protein